ncbi:putative tubulin polyglutamylase TTLL9 [Acropora cervicornis]|uniref:Tubulin polyglutamylase TTLL9 n=1 Tax=Acropora cervicornis TaxID=6130 RepID=A0AAD9UX12_ACRCE|nr:putative tubulin polyglutamylase TTLL9 [Acropora cervicornis]
MAAKREKKMTRSFAANIVELEACAEKADVRYDKSRVIRFKCTLQNTILDVLRSKGWTEVKEESEWDFYWCDVGWMREFFDHTYMEEHVKICHFRNHYELTRKNLMAKNLKRLKKQLEREYGKHEAAKYP